MRALLPLLMLGSVAQALHFFLDGTTPKCFFEDLPKDTLVLGHYAAEEWDDNTQSWSRHDGISIYISVDVSTKPPFHFSLCLLFFFFSNTKNVGNIRQRPPRSLPARAGLGKVHLHHGRRRRAQDLLHP